jgi:hypothetical protein
MPTDPEECRNQALECVRRAQSAITPQARETFVSLAKTWLKLAADIERSQSFSEESREPNFKKAG